MHSMRAKKELHQENFHDNFLISSYVLRVIDDI